MKSPLLGLLLLTVSQIFPAQKTDVDPIIRKKIVATKIINPPKIDGILDEDVWQSAPIAANFIERRPNNGATSPDSLRSEVKVLYDDTGVYFGAMLYDLHPEKIAHELTERDNIDNDDIFGVTINGYNDHQQSLEFLVLPTGVQVDAKITENEDDSWNAVWYSATKITDLGWVVEMKIPYSELRFPKKDVQEWGINFLRLVKRTNTMYDWNFVDNKKNSYMLYDGVLNGIENINPPTRLSFLPYISTYLNNYDGKTTASFNGGMDLKYGINDAFTLDLTLIPDFGQTSFDESVLNLSPFEQQFDEQRSFFTEGTELFNKGNLFYSRRIGGSPSKYPETSSHETVTEYPDKVKLFNAFKISGRTNKGLGIGFFNGITEKMEARILNENTGEVRTEVVEPWANYNVLVLDQRFHKNSSVSFVNTNVVRAGNFRDANSTALLWDINDKKNIFNYYGSAKGSWVMDNGTKFGTKAQVGFAKNSGKNQFDVNGVIATRNWDINDLGFSTSTNYGNYHAYYGYRTLEPTKKFNNIYLNFNVDYVQRLQPYLYSKLVFNHNNQFTTRNFRNYGGGIEFTPIGENDIYEPRVDGRYLKIPGYFDSWLWTESDSRKKFQYNLSLDYYAYNEKGRNLVVPSFYLRYRFSDKFKAIWKFNSTFSNNETGYAGKDAEDIFIGRRQRNTYENSITSQYTFNSKMAFSLAFRHYFSDVTYKGFYTLNQDGSLNDTSKFNENLNGSYNSWNVDLRYSWWFAPGSQLTILYRNAVQDYLGISRMNLKDNFSQLFKEPMVNNISLKLTYYIDYNEAKSWFRKKG